MPSHQGASPMKLFVGIDIGTSGVRAVCIDSNLETQASSSIKFESISGDRTQASTWAAAVSLVLSDLVKLVPKRQIRALSVDGTSGTVLLTNSQADPVSDAMMYNDRCDDPEILELIGRIAPANSAAHGATSGLAKSLLLSQTHSFDFIQHEADWIASSLSGIAGISDENNALKTGYDPVERCWPGWLSQCGVQASWLPKVYRAGEPIGEANGQLARELDLPNDALIVAGTTDGCASFLATGASQPGDAVTVLGSTLTIKLLSNTPIYAPEYGIYSHRIGDDWLAGGASNTGGKVLAEFFSIEQIASLSLEIPVTRSSGLDYYPLTEAGERFPINDSALLPRLEPRPNSDTEFLHGLLEGIARIESQGYQRLCELGAPAPASIRTMGGGAANQSWTTIRKRWLDAPFKQCLSDEAATGAAILALRGAKEAGVS